MKQRGTCLVTHDGMMELEDRTGVEMISRLPELVSMARRFTSLDMQAADFLYLDGAEWIAVQMRPAPTSQSGTLIEVRPIDPPHGISIRELDVLTLLSAGCSNEAIGLRLSISDRTVAKHVEHLSRKLDCWNRVLLAGRALDEGLLRLPVTGGAEGLDLSIFGLCGATPTRRRRRPTLRPIHIGLPYPADGRGSSDAAEMVNGAEMAVAEANRMGGIHGRRIELVPRPFAQGHAAAAYRDLIEREVEAVTAGYACYSPEVHDLMGAAQMPFLHAATMHQAVTRVRDSGAGMDNIFQTCASDINYAQGLLRFVAQTCNGMPVNKHLAVITPDLARTDIGLRILDEGLDRLGWEMTVIGVDQDRPDCWQHVIAQLHHAAPGVVTLASFFAEDAIPFQRAFLADPVEALIYMIYSPSSPFYRSDLGALSEGVVWATTSGIYSDMIGTNFRKRYSEVYGGHSGNSQAGLAYDRVGLLLGSWRRVGNPRSFGEVTSDLRTAITRGVNGSYYFGSPGQVGLAYPDDTLDLSISQAHLVFQLQGGRNTLLAPTVFECGELEIPPWFNAYQ